MQIKNYIVLIIINITLFILMYILKNNYGYIIVNGTEKVINDNPDYTISHFYKNDSKIEKDNINYNATVFFTDNYYHEVNNLNMISGNYLNQPYSAVLNKEAATEIFISKDIIGLYITYNNENYKISGIIEDYSNNLNIYIKNNNEYKEFENFIILKAKNENDKLSDYFNKKYINYFTNFRISHAKEITFVTNENNIIDTRFFREAINIFILMTILMYILNMLTLIILKYFDKTKNKVKYIKNSVYYFSDIFKHKYIFTQLFCFVIILFVFFIFLHKFIEFFILYCIELNNVDIFNFKSNVTDILKLFYNFNIYFIVNLIVNIVCIISLLLKKFNQ